MKEDTKAVDDESSTQLAQDSTVPEKSESTKKSANLISQKSLESSNQPSAVHETFLEQNHVNEANNKDQTIPLTDTQTCLAPLDGRSRLSSGPARLGTGGRCRPAWSCSRIAGTRL